MEPSAANAQTGTKKRRPLPYEYGEVIIKKHYPGTGFSGFQSDHWFHRMFNTCRLFHGEIDFRMKANAMGIPQSEGIAFDKTPLLKTKWGRSPTTIFPHKAHVDWLECNNCHPGILYIPIKPRSI